MARIVVVSASEATRERLCGLLVSSGFQVFRSCGSGNELRRALNESEDCVVIQAGRIPGCRPDDLIWDYQGKMQFLLIAKAEVLAECESEAIFRLSLPTSGQTVIGAVQILSQLHGMQMPKRTQPDKEIVERAKQLLMKTRGMTEPEAHREMQLYAMNHGIKMVDCAAKIIQASERSGK